MNDFTKDELKILYQAVYHLWNMIPTGLPVEIQNLSHKLECLIDNYCEHAEGYEQDSMMVDICKKCRRLIA